MKKYIISMILGLLFICIGSVVMFFEMMDYEYIDSLPSDLEKTTKTYTHILDDELYIDNFGDFKVVSDNNIEVSNVKIEVSYYDQFFSIYENKRMINGRDDLIRYDLDDSIKSPRYIYNFFIDTLKDKKIYNYELLAKINVTVYVNPLDLNKINEYNNSYEDDFYIKDETVFCAEMIEEIARDDEYIYSLSCLKSGTIFLIYEDGRKISLKEALENNDVTIYELLDKGLDVIKEEIR